TMAASRVGFRVRTWNGYALGAGCILTYREREPMRRTPRADSCDPDCRRTAGHAGRGHAGCHPSFQGRRARRIRQGEEGEAGGQEAEGKQEEERGIPACGAGALNAGRYRPISQIVTIAITIATNCSSTRNRISRCDVWGDPPRIML